MTPAPTSSAEPPQEPSPARRGGLRRRFFRLSLLVLVAWIGLGSWKLTRDPSASMRARVGEAVESVELQERLESEVGARTVVERLRVRSSSGLEIELALRLPRGASAASQRPLVLLLGGHRTGRDAVDLVPDARGAAVAAVSFPFSGDHDVKGLAIVPQIPAIQDALHDAPAALMLARKMLAERPEIDAGRIDVVGISLGAPFAVIAGALDPGFRRVWSIHGTGGLADAMEFGLRRKISFGPGRRFVAELGHFLAGGHGLRPESFAGRIAPREFVMINAAEDEKLPRPGIEALFEAASEPKQLIWTEGGHVRPKKEELIRELIDHVLDRLGEDGSLPDPSLPDGGF